jgi:hypothetical protein
MEGEMPRFLISFDDGAMDFIPEEQMLKRSASSGPIRPWATDQASAWSTARASSRPRRLVLVNP